MSETYEFQEIYREIAGDEPVAADTLPEGALRGTLPPGEGTIREALTSGRVIAHAQSVAEYGAFAIAVASKGNLGQTETAILGLNSLRVASNFVNHVIHVASRARYRRNAVCPSDYSDSETSSA